MLGFLYGLVTPTTVTAEQAAASFFFEKKRRTFFEKARFLGPQAMFTAEQAAADVLFFF